LIQTLTAPLPVRLANTGLIADRYRCVSGLGQGATGTVYAAWDKVLGKVVALKILHGKSFQDAAVRARFMREAKIMSRLSHRNIVQILHMSVLPDGRPFMAMDYVRGRSLSECIKEHGRLDCGTAANITAQIAKALSHAHNLGVVHRDVKPDNVVLEVMNGSLTAQLIDFGIARLEFDNADPLTGANNIIGTPSYMSPEQCCGEQLDGRSDIYSLGCMFFEMLTGQAPYSGSQLINIIWRQCHDQMPRVVPLEKRDKVPDLVQTILRKSTVKNKEDRYQTADEMLEDLRELIATNSSARLKSIQSKERSHTSRLRPASVLIGIATTMVALCAAWQLGVKPHELALAPYAVALQTGCTTAAACNRLLQERTANDLTTPERLRLSREYFRRHCSSAATNDDQRLATLYLICALENVRERTGITEPMDAVMESTDYLLEHKEKIADYDKLAIILNRSGEVIFSIARLQGEPENIHRIPDVRTRLYELALFANLHSRAFAKNDLGSLRSTAAVAEAVMSTHITDADNAAFEQAFRTEAEIAARLQNPHRDINLALARIQRLIYAKDFLAAKQKLTQLESIEMMPSKAEKEAMKVLHKTLD
jgi:tRNA A-37 threonylcarbamoyl transferase component Bud32